jgi:hypothetical protein
LIVVKTILGLEKRATNGVMATKGTMSHEATPN